MKHTIINYYNQGICINRDSFIELLDYREINHISYHRPYTIISTIKKKEIFVSYSLVDFISNLPDFFVSPRRSTCLNMLEFTHFSFPNYRD
ncbi:hypothetical protein FACS189455_3070 [Bacteroidia bacterium]|nr:hypothetical protein FACS189455_3070 [Bacteroidia bacterium]